jgi:hypothetical protein
VPTLSTCVSAVMRKPVFPAAATPAIAAHASRAMRKPALLLSVTVTTRLDQVAQYRRAPRSIMAAPDYWLARSSRAMTVMGRVHLMVRGAKDAAQNVEYE